MQKKDAKRHKIKGDNERRKRYQRRKTYYLKKVRKEKVNKFGPRMPETLRDALNSISMAMDVHIYTYFVKSS